MITEKQKPIAGKNIIGKITTFINDDKTAMATIDAKTINSFDVNKILSGLIKAIIKGQINNNILSIGNEVRLFTVQKKNSITNIKFTNPASNQ